MKLTLNALFDYVNNDGIFTYLDSFDVPWKETVDADLIDLDYHSKHGTKIVSKTVTSLLSENGLSSANKTKLAKLLYQKNKKRWDYLWESVGLYDDVQSPLDNTDWTETRVLGHQGADSRNQSIGAKQTTYQKGSQTNSETIGQSTLTEGQQNNITGQQTISMEEKKSSFNSNNYSPLDQKTEQLGQRTDTLGQKVNTDSGRSNSSTEGQRSDSTNEGAQSNSETGTNTFTDNETISRHGNIGITTPGQMIRDFRQTVNWQFFETIYKDIDEMLVIEIYGKEDDDFDDYTIVTGYVLPVASASKLGGIKVGDNLQIASDGTLKAVVETGVDSVNGQTGAVVLDAEDVGATTSQDVSDAISTAVSLLKQVPDGGSLNQVLRKLADGYGWSDAKEVPSGGNLNQVLTKTADGYGWADSQGGGGGGNIVDVPYILKPFAPDNDNGKSKWTAGSGYTRSYVFDISQYVGKWFKAYFIPKTMSGSTNRHRMAFFPDFDLDTAASSGISGSWMIFPTSNSNDGTLYGQVMYQPGGYGWDASSANNRSSYRYGCNYYEGIIPAGMKYLSVYSYVQPSSEDFYNNDIICKCLVEN